jgi:manganese transport protein
MNTADSSGQGQNRREPHRPQTGSAGATRSSGQNGGSASVGAGRADPPGRPWWRAIGPALITACVVFGPGSLIINANVGATYGYQLVWLLVLTGVLMGTYVSMGARVGVCGGATPCTLLAQRLGRPMAFLIGLTLCLVCTAFQFSNNLAVALAAGAFLPETVSLSPGTDLVLLPVKPMVVVGFNALVILFLFTARQVYQILERAMKILVAVILICFVVNLLLVRPNVLDVLKGFVPSWPEQLRFEVPKKIEGGIEDPMILVASLLGTTFAVAAAFFQGNMVREKNWTLPDYENGIVDAIAGVAVLTCVSMIIMITTATVLPGQKLEDVGQLAQALQPLLGPTAFTLFAMGLFAVAMNPFVINAVIGGTILADGLGLPARMSDRASRLFTVLVMLVGMAVAMWALVTGNKPVPLMIFGQALTVVGNPLMAAALLWLANRPDIMGHRRNRWPTNLLGGVGFLVVLLLAIRVLWRVVLQLS